jgi:atypical dual specificity phosphatase
LGQAFTYTEKLFGNEILDKKRDYISAYKGPSGFNWLVNGLLGGVRRPGIFSDLRQDVELLQNLGVSLLVTLNENWEPPVSLLEEYNIDSYQLKITDLQAPTLAEALEACQLVDSYLSNNKICVYHCRAGKGRTGTLLAAQLMFYGLTADEAVTETRAQNPRWIESDAQIAFLASFESHVRDYLSDLK